MTDAEFEQIRAEARAYVQRTTFAPAARELDDYEAADQHAEYGASRH